MHRQRRRTTTAPSRVIWSVGLIGGIALAAALASVVLSDVGLASQPDRGPQDLESRRSTGASHEKAVLFIENAGQFAPAARFQAWGGAETAWLAEDAIWLTRFAEETSGGDRKPSESAGEGTTVRLTFPGANPHPGMQPYDRLAARVSYLLGDDPHAWRSNLPAWSGVRYEDLYPGITLEVSAGQGGLLMRFSASPGANVDRVQMRVEGAESVSADSGALLIASAPGHLEADARASVATEIDLPEGREATFEILWMEGTAISKTSRGSGEVLDAPRGIASPVYATYLGGSGADEAFGVALDSAGATYVTGYTKSSDFPTQPGVFDRSLGGGRDAFVAKLNPSGGLIYTTFLGGSGSDWAFDIAVDGAGSAYVTGYTASTNFPVTTNAADSTPNGGNDAFLAKLNPSGAQLLYGAYLGGSLDDGSYALAVDASGAAYLAGGTDSADFTTSSAAFDRTHNGGRDAFVAKINPAANPSLVYSTLLGGADHDEAEDIAVDPVGNAIVTGGTSSAGFPVTNPWDATYNGIRDAFLVKLAPNGSGLGAATFIGGNASDAGNGIALDAGGDIYVTGGSSSADFPATAGVFGRTWRGGEDAFVAVFNPDGRTPRYITLFGGSGNEGTSRVAVDSNGSVNISGRTESDDLPVSPNATDPSYNGLTDAYLAVISADGTRLSYGTYLGGSGRDGTNDLKLDAAGHAHLCGATASNDFPVTTGAMDISYNGDYDAFVAELVAPASTLTPTPTMTRTSTTTSTATATRTSTITRTRTPTPTRPPGQVASRIYLPLLLRQPPSGLTAPSLQVITPPEDNPSYTVRWLAVVGAASYVLERATSSAFGEATQVYAGPATEHIASSAGIATYHFRVKAASASGDSGWSNVQAVEVRWELEPNASAAEASGPLAAGRDFYGYPETLNDYFYFDAEAAGEIRVAIANHSGQGGQVSLWHQSTALPSNRKATCAATPDCTLVHVGPAGRYYVQIYTASEHNSATPYTLRATFP